MTTTKAPFMQNISNDYRPNQNQDIQVNNPPTNNYQFDKNKNSLPTSNLERNQKHSSLNVQGSNKTNSSEIQKSGNSYTQINLNIYNSNVPNLANATPSSNKPTQYPGYQGNQIPQGGTRSVIITNPGSPVTSGIVATNEVINQIPGNKDNTKNVQNQTNDSKNTIEHDEI